jgi:antitoxin component of MazEF toxin-antitoxin module
MMRRLVRTGNSVALILTRDMKDHLGITDVVEVQIAEGRIILSKPLTLREASTRSDEKLGPAYERLAQ